MNTPAVYVKPVEVPVVEDGEILGAKKKINENKTQEPEGVPSIVPRMPARTSRSMCFQVVTAYFREGELPEQLEVQRSILIPKSGKPL